ncbi:MAG: hypothetical protein GOU99_01685 [Candidatus Altiarchaeota archaeon]|nr:hypothetical protein [Candidatus Altiarchaeota archaeon]
MEAGILMSTNTPAADKMKGQTLGQTMRGQTQMVGTVVLLLVVVALVSEAFLIGGSLLQKNKDKASITYLRNSVEDVSESAATAALEGGELRINLDVRSAATAKIMRDETEDYVISVNPQLSIPFFAPEWTPLNDESSPYTNSLKEITLSSSSYSISCSCSAGTVKEGKIFVGGELKMLYACDDAGDEKVSVDGICYSEGNRLPGGDTISSIDVAGNEVTVSGGTIRAIGLLGKNSPFVVIARSLQFRGGVRTEFRIVPRPLRNPVKGTVTEIELIPSTEKSRETKLPSSLYLKKISERVETKDGVITTIITVEAGFE